MSNHSYNIEPLDWPHIKAILPRRAINSHKGDNGHTLLIGGDYGMGGAVRMAAEAALRVGSGLVSVATRPEHVPVVSGSRPEIMCHQVTCGDDLIPLLEKADVIAIGPGLGQTDWAKELLAVVFQSKLPKVLDADALNLLSKDPQQDDSWVLTPHPGEASRLLDTSCQEIQDDRPKAITQLQDRYKGVVALKGAGSLVKGNGEQIKICQAGNPGMATGGMGDVLTGVIAGLIAQGLSVQEGAEAGVLIHSMAGDLAAKEGGERGLLPTDLMDHIRDLVNED